MSIIAWAGGLPGNYNVTLGSSWVGGIAPGPNDTADFNAAQTGPYTLLGNASWAETQFEGDTATVKGTITASDIVSTELVIENGGMLTIASGAAFLGSYNAQIGAAATSGMLAVFGTLSMGALDIYQDGVLGITSTAVVTGDINMLGGQLAALAPGGTIVSLDNAVHLLSNGTLLAAAPAATLELTGGIDGTGKLAVVYGNVALDAADSYTGGTTIASGATLLAGADDALGSGVITISGVLIGTQTETLHNQLQTSGNAVLAAASGTTLVIDGRAASGALGLSGNITFGTSADDGVVYLIPGATGGPVAPSYTIAAGTWREAQFGLVEGYALSIAGGATLDLNGVYDFANTVQGTGVITSESGPGYFTFVTGTFGGTVAGQTSLSITGHTTLTGAEISSLGVSIKAGATLQLGNGGGIGAFTAPSIDDEGTLLIDIGTAATIASAISGAGSLAVTGTAPVTLDHANAYTGGTSIASGATILVAGDDELGSGVITVSGALIGVQTATLHNELQTSGQALIAAAAGTTLALDGAAASGNFQLAGGITFGAAGDSGVVEIGIGGGSWLTPSFTIAAGTMREIGHAFIEGYGLSIASGATLDVNGHNEYDGTVAGTGVITSESGPGGFAFYTSTFAGTIAGQTSLSIYGNTTLTGADVSSLGVFIGSGEVLQLGNGGSIGAFTAPSIDDEGALRIDIGTAASIASAISGAGSLAVTGTAPVTLDHTNAYAGGTSIASGATIIVAADDALGSGVITVSGALLGAQSATLHNELQTSGNALIAAASGTTLSLDGAAASGVFGLGGGITFGAAGYAGVVEIGLGGGSWLTPSFTIAAGTMREIGHAFIEGYGLSIASGATLDVNGHNEYDGTVAGTGVITSESGPGGFAFYTSTFAGTIAGQTSLSIYGNTTLTGADVSSLGVFIGSGEVLQLGNGGGIGAFTAPSIDDEGSLLIDIGTAVSIASAINGAGKLAITGGGVVTLAGANAYTGGTTLGAGTLALGSGTALGVSGLSITGGTLLGETPAGIGNAIALGGTAHIGAIAGSTLSLTGAISGFGNIIADTPGLLALEHANNYTGGTTLGAGAAVYAGNAAAFGASDVLLTGNDTLIVGNESNLIETIDGFAAGDVIELAGFTAETLSFAAGVLSAVDGHGITIELSLSGAFTDSSFQLHTDAAGTEIAVCYLRGTRIATPSGEVEIERLRPGDLVTTRTGARRIKWIGEQRYARRFLKDNRDMLPVCISAGALADGVPARDLFVSPGHAMLLGNRLVLARDLVNGVTITQFWAPEEVHYFNIELKAHNCLLAEGAWAETYADCPGLRAKFHNAASFHALYPDHAAPAVPRLCAPRVSAGPELAASLAPVLARAAAETSPGRLRGYLERAGADGVVSGWAQDEANPELPVLLEIICNGAAGGTVLAHEQRDDLRDAGIGAGRHGFRIKCPPGAAVELRHFATKARLAALPAARAVA